MNYIAELNAFYDLKMSGARLSPSATILWYCLMAICNRRRWENPFPASRIQIINLTELSDRTIRKARDELKSAGLIDYAPQGANRATIYTLKSIADQECCAKMHSTDSSTDEECCAKMHSTDEECCAKMHSTNTEVLCKNAHYIKHIENNNKNTILSKSNLDDSDLKPSDASKERAAKPKKKQKEQTVEYTEAFLRFWEVYPIHDNKIQAFNVWQERGLEKSQEIVEAIIAYTEYKKNTSWKEQRYIQNPNNFLSANDWQDILRWQQENKQSKRKLSEELAKKSIAY